MSAPLGQTDFGSDISTAGGLDPSFGIITGTRVVAESIARRLVTVRGQLPDSPNYGTDIRNFLNESINLSSGTSLTQIKNAIERECLQEERVQTADAAVFFNSQTSTMNITVALGTSLGPFKLVLAVTAVTVTLLSSG